jgi:glycosyltransferase involved in cell wall biosynthesis
MNVVLIGPFAFAPKATVSARAFPIAKALTKMGHRVSILLAPYDNLAEAGKVEEREGVQVLSLPLRRVTALTPLTSAWRLAGLARRIAPDIVHVFKPVGYASLAGMILSATSGLTLVTDTDDWEGTGGWNSVNRYRWYWRRFFDFQERWLPRHSAAVTVASKTLQTQVWGMGVPPGHVFYIPNCLDPDFLEQRQRIGEAERARIRCLLAVGDAPMAIYVGHITLGDDLDLALLAFRHVLGDLPTAKLVIVGAGDGLEPLRSQVKKLGLSDAVVFTGWVDHQQVPAYLSAADVALYPYRDSLVNRAKCSIKILEYMAMGKAIVTHRVGQNTEYLEHNRSGFLAEPGDDRAFAQGLLACLTDPGFASRLGAEAAARVERDYNWRKRILVAC